MNSYLICGKGAAPQFSTVVNVPIDPTYAKVKLLTYKVAAEEKDGELVIPENDAKSGILLVHCSLWPQCPIGFLASSASIINPDITIPLGGSRIISGEITFTLRDMSGQLANVGGEFGAIIEFHK